MSSDRPQSPSASDSAAGAAGTTPGSSTASPSPDVVVSPSVSPAPASSSGQTPSLAASTSSSATSPRVKVTSPLLDLAKVHKELYQVPLEKELVRINAEIKSQEKEIDKTLITAVRDAFKKIKEIDGSIVEAESALATTIERIEIKSKESLVADEKLQAMKEEMQATKKEQENRLSELKQKKDDAIANARDLAKNSDLLSSWLNTSIALMNFKMDYTFLKRCIEEYQDVMDRLSILTTMASSPNLSSEAAEVAQQTILEYEKRLGEITLTDILPALDKVKKEISSEISATQQQAFDENYEEFRKKFWKWEARAVMEKIEKLERLVYAQEDSAKPTRELFLEKIMENHFTERPTAEAEAAFMKLVELSNYFKRKLMSGDSEFKETIAGPKDLLELMKEHAELYKAHPNEYNFLEQVADKFAASKKDLLIKEIRDAFNSGKEAVDKIPNLILKNVLIQHVKDRGLDYLVKIGPSLKTFLTNNNALIKDGTDASDKKLLSELIELGIISTDDHPKLIEESMTKFRKLPIDLQVSSVFPESCSRIKILSKGSTKSGPLLDLPDAVLLDTSNAPVSHPSTSYLSQSESAPSSMVRQSTSHNFFKQSEEEKERQAINKIIINLYQSYKGQNTNNIIDVIHSIFSNPLSSSDNPINAKLKTKFIHQAPEAVFLILKNSLRAINIELDLKNVKQLLIKDVANYLIATGEPKVDVIGQIKKMYATEPKVPMSPTDLDRYQADWKPVQTSTQSVRK